MKIDVQIKPDTLQLVNIAVSKMRFNQDKEGRIDWSIAQILAVKLARKQFSLLGKDKSKFYKLSFHFFEAHLLEKKIRLMLNHGDLRYAESNNRNTLFNFCNDLHQKMT